MSFALIDATHELLEHPSEARLRVRARTFVELLAEAGYALAELELRGAEARINGPWRELEVRASDRAALLVDWLNHLIQLAERDRWVALDFEIHEVADTLVRARARGCALLEHVLPLVKAATLHDARVVEAEDGCEAEVTLHPFILP